MGVARMTQQDLTRAARDAVIGDHSALERFSAVAGRMLTEAINTGDEYTARRVAQFLEGLGEAE